MLCGDKGEAVPEQIAAGFGPIVSQKRKENRLGVFTSVHVHATLVRSNMGGFFYSDF